MKKKQKIVTIGGGSGQFALLSGLRDIKEFDITAIVSMVDSGGSTGRLRDEYGILPPGDVLKCVLALSPERDTARNILQTRFVGPGRLADHNAGNMLLTILSQYAGSFPEGINALASLLGVRGKVLPVTIDRATLVAELTDGSRLYGEAAIDVPRGKQREKIKRTYLVPHHADMIKVYEPVIKAIKSADYILIGPGDLYTSITPNFLVPGVKEAITKTKAKILYIANIMTKFGETDNFSAEDFIEKIEKYIGRRVNKAITNIKQPEKKLIQKYKKEKAFFVKPTKEKSNKIIGADLIDTDGDIIRHDSQKLARLIEKIINK